MGYWNTRGLRGSSFEEMINITNENYSKKNLCIIQKIPTPIKPIKLDNKTRTITLAYFEQKSTVDYIGVVQGIPICFDAKETSEKNFPLKNIHEHQIEFMEKYENQRGISFLLVRFSSVDEIYYLPFKQLKDCWEKSIKGERKSIPYKSFRKDLLVKNKNGFIVHYLEAINIILEQ
jgi:recombination protein U